MSFEKLDNKYQAITYDLVFDDKRKFKFSHFTEEDLPYKCPVEYFKTYLDKDKKPISAFNPTNMLILSNRSKKPFDFILPGCYIETMFKSPFTHSTVFICGYPNDKEKENNIYSFFEKICDTIEEVLPQHEQLTKNFVISQRVKNPIQGFRYFPVYPAETIDINECKKIVRSDEEFELHFSVVLIKHKGFYVPFFFLNKIY